MAQQTAAPPVVQQSGGGFGGFMRGVMQFLLVVLIFTVIGGGALYVIRPDVVQSYLPFLPSIEQVVPQSAPTTPALSLQKFTTEVEITVPADANQDTIRQEFIAAYKAKVNEQFGPAAQVSSSTTPAYQGGDPVKIDEADGQITYRVNMSAFVFAP